MSSEEKKTPRTLSLHPSYAGLSSDRHFTSATSGTSLTHADISRALLDSTDNGKTLDFSHKNISDVGESGAEELAAIGVEGLNGECIVSRVALGYNRLATLPMAFALLTHLRYLNLRANSFTVFPEVLTVMPFLEVLDISRNKLKRLPSQPGSLLGLRVLSMAKNRLTRLPSYISKASKLTVLQLDHNPLEWPPRSIWEPLQHTDDPESMASQIDTIRKWISDHSNSSATMGDQSTSYLNEGVRNPRSAEIDLGEDVSAESRDFENGIGQLRHSRSFSAESDISQYSTTSHESNTSDMSFYATSDNEIPSVDIVSPVIASPHNTNELLSKDINEEFAGESSEYSQQRSKESNCPSKGKKAFLNYTSKFSLPSPPRERHGMLRSRAYTSDGSVQSSESEIPGSPLKKDTDNGHKAFFPDSEDLSIYQGNHSHTKSSVPNVASSHGMAPPMDVERNSYFRRISTLPPLSVQRTLPEPLSVMVDSARGILFAVSQIYQSLRHYIVFAIDDRLSGLLSKVLEPASKYMSHLINALDRFDSTSRRSVPPPHICRSVVESCKDNVAVFGKVIGVLHIQLKVLTGVDDARYSRSLLSMLYGSMVEISHSWNTMVPYFDSLMPHLKDTRTPPPASKSSTQITPQTPLSSNGITSRSTPSPTPRTPASAGSLSNGRMRLNRRHAGSFSFKDVEMGRAMLSDTPADGPLSVTAPLRIASKKPSSPQNSQSTPVGSPSDMSQQNGATLSSAAVNVHNSSSSQIPSSPSRQGSSGNKPANSLDPPTESFRIVDENLLDTVEAATETASSVWKMLDDVLRFGDDSNSEFSDALKTAQIITGKLSENVRKFRGKSLDSNRKAFWEDAHAFVKIVVNVLTLIKTRSNHHPFSLNLRNNIAKLTQSTQDFAILLQVSSFSPAPTPNLYSPAQTPVTPVKPAASTIGRSRSAQASYRPPAKLNEREPWSALPHHSFKIPTDP